MGSYPITPRSRGPLSHLSVRRETFVDHRCSSQVPVATFRGDRLPCATARAAARPRAGGCRAATAIDRPRAAPHRPHRRGAVASGVSRTGSRTGPWRCPVRVRARGGPAESAHSRDHPQTRQKVPHRPTPRLVGQVVAANQGFLRFERGQWLMPGVLGSRARSGDRRGSWCARDRAGIGGVAAHPGGAAPASLGAQFSGEDARCRVESPRRTEATKEDGHQGRYDVHLSACFHQVDWARGCSPHHRAASYSIPDNRPVQL